jgi:hypothetical protein
MGISKAMRKEAVVSKAGRASLPLAKPKPSLAVMDLLDGSSNFVCVISEARSGSSGCKVLASKREWVIDIE